MLFLLQKLAELIKLRKENDSYPIRRLLAFDPAREKD
jgi:hypothetical protein